MRGYFEIGIYHPKTETNIGTLWRSAYQLGATGIFTIGRRYHKQSSDTTKAWRHVPLRHYLHVEEMLEYRPAECELVGIEMGGKPLGTFTHPERGIYLLGAEDAGLPPAVLKFCNRVVSLESIGPESYNVAVAGTLVAYDRVFGRGKLATAPRLEVVA